MVLFHSTKIFKAIPFRFFSQLPYSFSFFILPLDCIIKLCISGKVLKCPVVITRYDITSFCIFSLGLTSHSFN